MVQMWAEQKLASGRCILSRLFKDRYKRYLSAVCLLNGGDDPGKDDCMSVVQEWPLVPARHHNLYTSGQVHEETVTSPRPLHANLGCEQGMDPYDL